MSSLAVSAVSAASDIPRADWEQLAPAGHPFLNADFLAILERHGMAGPPCGWTARHLVAHDGSGATLGILPLYVRANSHGDFIHDWSWAAAYRQLGKPYYPKLLSGLPHTPARGPRLLVRPGRDTDAVSRALITTALQTVAAQQLSSWHVAFPTDHDPCDCASIPLVLKRLAGLRITNEHIRGQWHVIRPPV